MQAKLFLFYLRFRKSVIILSAIAAFALISLDNWQRYKYRTADYTPWKISSVDSGSSFTVVRHNQQKTIRLCGVMATGDQAKNFLTSVINLGDGTVNLENVSDAYEAWVTIKPNYDVNLLKHISDTPNELVQQEIHLNTWVIERGMARRNSIEADQCREPEHLAWAEEVAQKNKLGIWFK
jgi:endonuclease YncB( thermonuclease family)